MNFYIPVEVKDRELYAKLLLAKFASEHGFNAHKFHEICDNKNATLVIA